MAGCLLLLQGAAATIFILLVTQALSSSAIAISGGGCIASEREALISLKKTSLDPAGRIMISWSTVKVLVFSWRGKDCCGWKGVRCSNRTGHVVKLDLRGQEDYYPDEEIIFGAQISSSIAALRHLRYLDLGFNFFSTDTTISLGTLTSLRYLNLEDAEFSCTIPPQLGNLSRLQYLDLSNAYMNATDLSWLPRLSSLKILDMSGVDLNSVRDWVPKVNMLPNLETLFLQDCGLQSTISTVSHSNLTHLEILDLSLNPFSSSLQRNWFWNVSTIKKLFLSGCGWSGPIPDALGTMLSLEILYLDTNYISGIIPATLENLCNLQVLDLNSNNIKGNIMQAIPECSWSKLRELDLKGANLIGELPVWIGNLINLNYFDISQNMLVGGVPLEIGNLSSLSYLDFSQNMMHGHLPVEIGGLSNLTSLNVGFNNFSGMLSEGHFASLVNLEYLDLSENSFKLDLAEDWVPPFRLTEGHFGSCDMGDRFPTWLKWQIGLTKLDISNTGIDDVLPHWFWTTFNNTVSLDLSRNQLRGTLPATLELPSITDMDLSRNSLSGQLPANITVPFLKKLLFYNNHFTGTIPDYVCNGFSEINLSNNQLNGDYPQCQWSVSALGMIDLKSNNLSGEFPRFLRNAAKLSFLDLSYNKFSGSVPTWIADKMPLLKVLILRSNLFHGNLPKQLSKLVGLHYLDVAHNNLSGSIPSSLARLRDMAYSNGTGRNNYSSDSISTIIKDRELNYTHKFIEQIVLIDLSSNGFTGKIPKELSLLKGLRSLNLSSNQISGLIPDDIGALRELESLDLSYNYLNGQIPSSLSELTFLSCLNLSYNDLSGRIPSGQQLQTLNDQYMYIGNPGLCGPPLLKNCSTNETNQDAHEEHEGTTNDVSSYYLSMSIGFLMGLWLVFCTMLFKKTWRIAYFLLLDKLYDMVYVQVAVSKAALVRKFQSKEI
ncbi:hypothetical protein ACP70R_037243 [Stipagrostis hirtigluma subsp. patula]